MTDDAGSVRCGPVQETIVHVLRDCKFTAKVWLQQINGAAAPYFFELELEDWLLANLKGQNRMGSEGEETGINFFVIGCFQWKQRNEALFQQK